MKTVERRRYGVRVNDRFRCSRQLQGKRLRCTSSPGKFRGVDTGAGGRPHDLPWAAAGSFESTVNEAKMLPMTLRAGRVAASMVFVAGFAAWIAWMYSVIQSISGAGTTIDFSEFLWQFQQAVYS